MDWNFGNHNLQCKSIGQTNTLETLSTWKDIAPTTKTDPTD